MRSARKVWEGVFTVGSFLLLLLFGKTGAFLFRLRGGGGGGLCCASCCSGDTAVSWQDYPGEYGRGAGAGVHGG